MFIRVKLGGDGQSRAGSSLRPTTAGSTGGHAAGTYKSASYNTRPSPPGSTTGAVHGGQHLISATPDYQSSAGDGAGHLRGLSSTAKPSGALARLGGDSDTQTHTNVAIPTAPDGAMPRASMATPGPRARHSDLTKPSMITTINTMGALTRTAWIGVRSAGFNSSQNNHGRRDIRIPQGQLASTLTAATLT